MIPFSCLSPWLLYVSEHVPQATGQEQHPVKKGNVEGRLILGVVE
jgi:hypothetical protein